jgi:hypothetical protein
MAQIILSARAKKNHIEISNSAVSKTVVGKGANVTFPETIINK